VGVTLATRPTEREVLYRFCELVRPAGPGWRMIRRERGLPASPDSLPQALLAWVVGCGFVYAALFGFGNLLYGRHQAALFWLIAFLLAGVILARVLAGIWSARADESA